MGYSKGYGQSSSSDIEWGRGPSNSDMMNSHNHRNN